MKRNGSPRVKTNSILGSLFVLSLLLCSSVSYAQSPANFSGVWIQDTTKSDDFYKSFEVKYTITQTLQTFTVKQTFTLKSSKEIVTDDYSFTLDGKVTSIEKEGGIEKELAQWSTDKKILTTRSTMTYGNEDVGFTETYSLSDNGLVLTVQKSNIIPGVPTVKQVFNKKQ
ncbi:MAG: hypothetical protein NTZ85_06140 [Bacteroidia bacterium]|nr:hypothetical protein [Bacteroidia bacterium]